MSERRPIFVAKNQVGFTAICDACVAEKRGWPEGEDLGDVQVSGKLPLEQEEGWFDCPRGHRSLVVREGSERADSFR